MSVVLPFFNGHGAKATFQFCGHDNVSWDDYSQYMEKWKMFQTTNQMSDAFGCFQ